MNVQFYSSYVATRSITILCECFTDIGRLRVVLQTVHRWPASVAKKNVIIKTHPKMNLTKKRRVAM